MNSSNSTLKNETVDLVEFNWDHQRGVFVKKQTHLTNVSKTLAYGTKKKLPIRKGVIYQIVPNGKYQHSNRFSKSR